MEIITGFTNTPHITAEMDRDINIGIFGEESYIVQTGMKLKAEISTNNEIKIRDGVLMHQGCAASIKKNTYDSLTIINGSQGMKRIDLIIARYSRDNDTNIEKMELMVIQGSPSETSPEIPKHIEGDIQSGDSIADMPLYQVLIDGLNIVGIKQLFQVIGNITEIQKDLDKLNSKLKETIYTRSDISIADFYNIGDFDLRKKGNQVFFNITINAKAGTTIYANNLYSIGPAPFPEELRPNKTYYINGFGCDNSYGNAVQLSAIIEPQGYVKYSTPKVMAFYKFSGSWFTD